jgi:hypothetical protein
MTFDRREEKGMADEGELDAKIGYLEQHLPLTVHTGVGRLVTTVRRMKAEKELGIPINRRTGFAVSVKHSKPANELEQDAWEEFFSDLCADLRRYYPDLYADVFNDREAQP